MDSTKEGLARREFLKNSSALGLSLASPLASTFGALDMGADITSMSASELSLEYRQVKCFRLPLSDLDSQAPPLLTSLNALPLRSR